LVRRLLVQARVGAKRPRRRAGNPALEHYPVHGLTAWLRDKTSLIVLDSCEHVIGAAATLAEAVLKAASSVSILTTSREPLRAEGETLHRLAALDLPSNSVDLTAGDSLRYSAIQLFNERGMAAADSFAFADADVPSAFEICRRSTAFRGRWSWQRHRSACSEFTTWVHTSMTVFKF